MSAHGPSPAGVGKCRVCPYLETGTSTICYRCARNTIEPLPEFDERCVVCDLPLKDDGTCGNPICNWSEARRGFDWNFAIAMRSGVLEKAINDFKYRGRHGWRNIFARVLVGFLDQEAVNFEDFDLIVASPTFVGADRAYDHTRDVIVAAAREADGRWPFDTAEPQAVVKSVETPRFAGLRWRERKDIAEGQLRAALAVPDRARTEGRGILVYDDVFTDGFTLREVALCLKRAGATRVCGVTLSRQPFRG